MRRIDDWRLQDGNNQIIADGSEGYSTRDGVLRAIQNVISTVISISKQ